MKKIIFFLILIISVITIPTITHAQTYRFYEAEYIDGIWINKYNPNTRQTFFQTARFFRQIGTNDFAYCIETFNMFNESGEYITTNTPPTLTKEQKNRISQIAHFGYGYKNHTDVKWYAITQFMIWQTANPEGDYYFTDALNGNRITRFTNEINEINNLIKNYNTLPYISNKTYTLVEGQEYIANDPNNVLKYYKSNNKNITINQNNTLEIKNLKEGNYTFTMERNSNIYNKPVIFFQSNTSQDLVETGNIDKKSIKINVEVISTSIKINKIDSKTKDFKPTGEGILDGAIYELYTENNAKVTELEINNNQAEIKNLDFGTYYIKEKQAGIGYNIDNKTYKITIDKKSPKQELTLENSIIEAKLIIKKQYNFNNELQPEKNIKFNIYNKKKELIDTIKTNNAGIAEIILPYGEYIIEQINTTEGYTKVENKTINVANEKNILLNLENYKIKVPNTNTEYTIFDKILSFIINILC